MTREEDYTISDKWWQEHAEKFHVDCLQVEDIVDRAFWAGAKWADEHPHWISVEDKLPPMGDEDGMSDKVLTHSKGGGIYFNRYDYGHNTWGNPYAFNVTHWMHLPQAPSSSEFPNNSKEGGEE